MLLARLILERIRIHGVEGQAATGGDLAQGGVIETAMLVVVETA
jgi:hypothetical protein